MSLAVAEVVLVQVDDSNLIFFFFFYSLLPKMKLILKILGNFTGKVPEGASKEQSFQYTCDRVDEG